MAYLSLDELKRYLGITDDDAGSSGTGDDGPSSPDDTLLTELLEAAHAQIDRYTGRTFEAATDTVRTYAVDEDASGRILYLDADLCQITNIVTGGEALDTDDYTAIPRNGTPYYAITLRAGSGARWADDIEVTGLWAWSAVPPADIIQATRRLAAYLYRQKDAQVFDVTAQVATGAVTVRHQMPGDVRDLLDPYVRRV